jgi:hypothetical protein
MSGPCDVLDKLEGWHPLDMGLIQRLIAFARSSSEIQSLSALCYNSLRCGNIIIRVGQDTGEAEEDTLKKPTERQESDRLRRSALLGQWAYEAAMMEDAIGFVPTVIIPNEDNDTSQTDPLRPSVLNLARVRIWHKVDVMGRHYWRFYESHPNSAHLMGLASQRMLHEREIRDVHVRGDTLPDDSGCIFSRVRRVMEGDWALFQSKKLLTMTADRERATPTLVTQQANDKAHTDKDLASTQGLMMMTGAPYADGGGDMMADPSTVRAMALVREHNSCLRMADGSIVPYQERQSGASSMPSAATQQRARTQVRIDTGQQFVSAPLAEAPADLLPTRQAFLEVVSLEWGVPLSMISSGDASGKARLNSATAGAETAKVYQATQAHIRRRSESRLRELYSFMYGEKHVADYVRRVLQRYSRSRRDQGKASSMSPSKVTFDFEELQRQAQVTIEIPSQPSMLELNELLDKGVLEYDPYCHYAAQQTGISLRSFKKRQKLSDESAQINGCAPKEPAEGAPKKKKQKTSTSK